MEEPRAMVNDKREIFGWAMYDWANSAFSTTVATVFLGPYVTALATAAGATYSDGLARLGGIPIAPTAFWGICVSASVLLQVPLLPALGAIADYSHLRKRLLRLFATAGGVLTLLLIFVTERFWWLGGLLFIGANLAFGAAVVFYNAYLPDIASEDQRDRVSSYGWAMGYLGDGILLAINLAFFAVHGSLGVPTDLAIRINLVSAGVWWLSFSFFTWAGLRHRRARRSLPPGRTYLGVGWDQLRQTFRVVMRLPETLKFLLAYFAYNDGIQTVIAMSAIFATSPLDKGGLALDLSTLTFVILLIQVMAFVGALAWGRIAGWMGSKRSIILSLIIWCGAVSYAYFGLRGEHRDVEFAILGIAIALVLGGSQAISRSLFSQMIPAGREAEFFAFYEISDRGTSWLGPAVFAGAAWVFGSLRPAILSLVLFFVLGLVLLPLVDEQKAIRDTKATTPV